jgi:hypothetical protein
MYSYDFTLKGLKETCSFRIGSQKQADVDQFFYVFLSLFPGILDYETRTIRCYTNNSEELRNNLSDFVRNHEQKIPAINGVEAFVRRLKENESFYVIPCYIPNQKESIRLHNYLKAEVESAEFEQLNQQTASLFDDLMDDYTIYNYGDKRLIIGEREREKKVCRFCGNLYPQVSFSKKAHAISEALGNKTLILTEECDDCNGRFSQSIEPDLIEYLSLHRIFYGIKGKGGDKKFKGKNFEFFKKETVELNFVDEDDPGGKADFPKMIKLKGNRLISSQNLYRTLVKFFLSVIDREFLDSFSDTIDWVNGTHTTSQLPKIAVFTFYNKLVTQPTMTAYLRKTDKSQFPYAVGEFKFALTTYVFLLPFSNKDNSQFLTKEDYQIFWHKFRHYDQTTDVVKFADWSDDKKRDFIMAIELPID